MKTLSAIITLLVVVAFGGEALAQQSPSLEVTTVTAKRVFNPGGHGGPGYKWSFSAKFLCGTILAASAPSSPLVPGTYATAINIRNYNFKAVVLSKSALETVSEDALALNEGRIGTTITLDLPPRGGLEVDCKDIMSILFPSPSQPPDLTKTFIKGFVSLESVLDLDVVGVYTAR